MYCIFFILRHSFSCVKDTCWLLDIRHIRHHKKAMADSQQVFLDKQTDTTKLCEPIEDDVIADMIHDWESHPDSWSGLNSNTPLDSEFNDDEIMAIFSTECRPHPDDSKEGLQNEPSETSKWPNKKRKTVVRKPGVTREKKKAVWRKYGQKKVVYQGKSNGILRCYFRCNHDNCDGKKVVDYVDTLPIDSHMTHPHSQQCAGKSCSSRLPQDESLKPEDIGRLVHTHDHVYRIERLLATSAEIVCVDVRISTTPTVGVISEAFADSHLDVSAWVGQPLCAVCKQMVQTGEPERPGDARFYRTMVTLPTRTAYALLKIKTIDDNSEHATIMISKQDCTF